FQPALLLLGGAIAGAAVSVQQRQRAEAERRYRQVFSLWRTFYERHTQTVRATAELQRRLAAVRASTARLCPVTARPWGLREEDVYAGIIELLAPLLGVRRLAVYRLVDGALELRAGMPAEAPGRPRKLGLRDGEVHCAATGGMTAPLCGASGRPLGLLVIEDLPDEGLNASAAACVERVLG